MKLLVTAIMLVSVSIVFADDVVWEIAPPWSLVPGSSGQESRQTPKDYVSDSDKEQTQTQNPQKNTGNVPLLKAQPSATGSQTPRQQGGGNVDPQQQGGKVWGWVVFLCGIAVVVLDLGFNAYQSWHAKKATTLAEQSLELAGRTTQATERAYLTIGKCVLVLGPTRTPERLVCSLVNAGRTHATLLTSYLGYLLSTELPLPLDYVGVAPTWEGREMLGISPDECLQSITTPDLGTAKWKEIRSKSQILFFHGRIIYEDVFRERHRVEFFAQYHPDIGKFLMEPTPGYNYSP